MKKAIGTLSGIGTLLFFVSQTFAQVSINPCPKDTTGGGGFSILCRIDATTAVPGLATIIIVAAILVALFFLIWGGLKWITSGGDKAGVDSARGTVVAAIVGLVIIFLSWFFLNLLTQLFFGKPLSQILIIPTGLFQ